MMPSRHLRLGSKTPNPESPVVATSRIRVENFVPVACLASTTMTGAPPRRAVEPDGSRTTASCHQLRYEVSLRCIRQSATREPFSRAGMAEKPQGSSLQTGELRRAHRHD